jgi:K+ transporter
MNIIDYVRDDWRWLLVLCVVDISFFIAAMIFIDTFWVPLLLCVCLLFFNLYWTFKGGIRGR